MPSADEKDHDKNFADKDGHFRRQASQFRDFISSQPNARFPPEANRYILYINRGCPWAHRTVIVRALKGLENAIKLVETSAMGPQSWFYDGRFGTDVKDPITGSTKHRDLYYLANPQYEGRFTVPVLFDTKERTIVSNESADIIRMMYSEFDALLPEGSREVNKAGGGLFPQELRKQIEDMNDWVYNDINNGVYKTGFATQQDAYDANVTKLFESLDRVEAFLRASEGPYIFGKHLTEADIRLFTTIVRFDPAYYALFKCNIKMIRHGYPAIQKWLVHIYHDESEETKGAFKKTTDFEAIKHGYSGINGGKIVPKGPVPNMLPKTKPIEREYYKGFGDDRLG